MEIIEQTLFPVGTGNVKARRTKEEVFNDYDGFVEKFKPKKTTDDCMTPGPVYDAVLSFVRRHWSLEGREVIRPFWPGRDFTKAIYPAGCVVVDNPPFSILAKIIRWYCAAGVEFFLFAPSLTLFTCTDQDLTYVVTSSEITYGNGAVVRSGFITNLPSDLRIWCCPELAAAVEKAQPKASKKKRGFVYPDCLVTAATLQRLPFRGVDFRVAKTDCAPVRSIESVARQGRAGLFGGAYLLSTRAAAERAAAERAAAERAAAERAAAERAAATKIMLSDKELAIIAKLDKKAPAGKAGAEKGGNG